jgi:hypothetical protein
MIQAIGYLGTHQRIYIRARAFVADIGIGVCAVLDTAMIVKICDGQGL